MLLRASAAMVTPAPMVMPWASVVIAVSSSMPGQIDQQIRAGDAAPHVDQQIGAAGDVAAARMLGAGRDRFVDGARLGEMEIGQGCGHEAAFTLLASRACRRRWVSASMTRSGVTGISLRSRPSALAMALTRAGGKPASAPSLASLAPNGP